MGIAGRNGGGVGRGSRLGLGPGYFSNRFGVGPGNGLRGANGGRSGSGIGVGVGIGISTAGNRGFRTTGYPFRGVSGAGRFGLGSGIGVGIAQRNIRGPILLPSGGFGSAGANSRLRTSARGLGIGTGLGVGSGINIGAERGRVITPPGVMTNFGEPISGTGSRSGNGLATGFRDRGFANGGQIRGVGHAGNGLQITRGTRSGVGIGVGVGVGIGVGGGSSVRRSGVQVPGLIADTGFGIPTYGTGINGISGVGLGVGAGGSNVGVESGIGGLHTNGQMIGGAGGGSFGMGVGLGVEIGGTVDVSGKETTAGNILSMGGSNNIIEVIGPFFGSSGIGTGSKLIQGFDISMLEVQGVGAGPYSNTGMVNGGGNGMGIVMGSTSQGGNALGIPSGIGLGSQSSGMGTGGNGHASGTSIGGNGGGSAGGGVFGYLGGGGGGGGSGFVGDFASSLGRDVHHPRGYNVTNNIIIGPDAEVSENSLFGNSGHGTIV
ncbi:glycine-rich cell wall structural protein-like [Gigantopelta aegis]|uniref:glycine-rich cell wall structural protein-like n=1 Tax=Gigantopelta aegis TaxID=1735272 RepID=UPI001B88766C|nr:glycine-rich cell wall structural protein-like [Gigantopelta aegis]